MQSWSAITLAFVVGCGFDTAPRFRSPGSSTSADRNVTGLFYKDGGGLATGTGAHAGLDAATSDAAPADAAIVIPEDSSAPGDMADAARPTKPTMPVKSSNPPPPGKTDGADASVTVADSGKPPVMMPVTKADASVPDVDPATPPDMLRAQLVTLLRAAEFTRDERSITGLITLLVADAKTAADVQQILDALANGGQCFTLGVTLCSSSCVLIRQRCAVCTADAACKADLQKVCGVGAATCF